jgi:hypothetical protein
LRGLNSRDKGLCTKGTASQAATGTAASAVPKKTPR